MLLVGQPPVLITGMPQKKTKEELAVPLCSLAAQLWPPRRQDTRDIATELHFAHEGDGSGRWYYPRSGKGALGRRADARNSHAPAPSINKPRGWAHQNQPITRGLGWRP